MTGPLRRCLVCSALSTGSRCPTHDHRSKGNTARGYGPTYRRARAALLAGGPPCWRCGAPATTADHDPPLATFDDPAQWRGRLMPACARCNYGRNKR